MWTVTELKNILRVFHYTFTDMATELGISKSYLSKIINRKRTSRKYEELLIKKVFELQRTNPRNNIPKKRYKRFRCFVPCVKDISLRNGIQSILDKKKLTVTQLAFDINEA